MTTMPHQYPIEVRAEARRIADRTGATYDDLSRIEACVAATLFRQAIQPLQDMKVRAYSMATIGQMPRMFVGVDGLALDLPEPELPPDVIETLRGIDAMIAAEAHRFGVSPPEFPEYQTIGAEDGSD